MTGAAAASYEWSINGVVYATSESITVPASAAYGDRISVTVTAEDGETATDMVFVGGFTIVEVEPTTETASTYKYIRATFSQALDSLDPSEIEIRRKSDKQLFSVESVRLSKDGTVADITLFGDKDKADTEFLLPATVYVMTVTHDGFTDDLEFQLPDNRRDVVVSSVDVKNGTIETVWDGRTKNAATLPGVGQLTVGDAYLGNLGYLVGRNIIVGVNADNEVMNLDVEDQNVVIAKVKYVEKEAGNYDKNYFETPDGTKYFLVDLDSATTTVSATITIDAAKGGIDRQTAGAPALALADKDEFQYAKLVLNKNGRVATAVLQGTPAWSGHIITTETDGTQVIESADFALDFDGYTIVKDDEYVEVSDLEEGDICYYNSNDKFVDVYTESVTGNIEKITSEEITIDGTAYKWAGAQYLEDDKYKTLDQSDIDADLKYLYSLDEDEDTTIVLNRKGEVQVIDGVVTGEETTTTGIYVLTEDGAVYTIGKTTYIELNGTDDEAEKLVIDISKVTKYDGAKAKLAVGSDEKKYTVDGGGDNDGSEFVAGTPVKITKNDSGVVTEIDNTEVAKAHTGDDPIPSTGKAQTVDKDTTQLVTDGEANKITLKSSTTVYVVDDKKDDDGAAPFKVTKTTLGELTKTAEADKVIAYVKATSTAADYVLIDNTWGTAWTTTDTETIGGVVKAVTKGLNTSSGTEEVEAITLLTASGEVELDANELGYTTDYTPGKYITFTVKKDTYTLAAEAADTTEFRTTTLDGLRAYSDTKFTSQDGLTTISKAATAGVYVYDADAKTYTATTIGAVNTKKEQASLKYHVVDENTANVVTSDMMVVTYSGLANPATVTLDASALDGILTASTSVLGTTVKSTDSNLTGVTYSLEYLAGGTTWTAVTDGGLTVAANNTDLVVGSTAPVLLASTSYRIKAAGAPTAKFATVYSNVVTTAAPVATYVGTAANTIKTNVTASNTAHLGSGDAVDITNANKVLDQFGGLYAVGDADIASLATYTTADLETAVTGLTLAITDTTGTLTAAADGIGTATLPTSNKVYFEILGCVYEWTVTTS